MINNPFVFKKGSKIDKTSSIYPFSKFTNSIIGPYSYIGLFAFVNNTKIGKFCSISMNFKAGLGKHPLDRISTSPIFYKKKYSLKNETFFTDNTYNEYKNIEIGNDVWIGADVVIMDGVTIGNGAVIGAKAVVVKDVPSYSIVTGVPARVIKYRFSKDIINELNILKWWDWNIKDIKKYSSFFGQKVNMDSILELKKAYAKSKQL